MKKSIFVISLLLLSIGSSNIALAQKVAFDFYATGGLTSLNAGYIIPIQRIL